MKLSQIKAVKSFCNDLHSQPEWREVIENVLNDENDFTVNDVRFIAASEIDTIQQEELANDLYILGCFNTYFLADVLDIDCDVIEAMQEAEAFEAIGKLVISMGKLEELQAEYSRLDGYGHHFNHYNGEEEEITINGIDYIVFDNH